MILFGFFVRSQERGNKENFIQFELLFGFPGEVDVPAVNRIKRPSQNADSHQKAPSKICLVAAQAAPNLV